jgi:hypothetical protein
VKKVSEKPEERAAPGGCRCKRGIITINIKKIWTEGVDWIQVT